jgi:LPS-assembly protein
MELNADVLRYSARTAQLSAEGHVLVRTRQLTLHADHLEYDQVTGEAVAFGNASMIAGTTAALAERVHINVRTLESSVENAYFLQKRDIDPALLAATTPEQLKKAGKNQLALRGQRIRRRSANALDVEGLTFTPCDCDPLNPSWRVQATSAHVVTGQHAFLLWPVIYVGPVPVLAFPVLDLPLTDRRTGLLIPRPGVDPRRGFSLELPIFITLGRSYDLTLTPGYFFGATQKGSSLPANVRSVKGPRLVTDFRYAPVANVSGDLRLGLLYDLFPRRDPVLADCLFTPTLPGCAPMRPGPRGLRGDLVLEHQAALGKGFFTRLDATLVSDGYYLGDLSTDIFTQGTPYLRSTAVVYHRTDNTYVGLDVAYRQDLRYGYSFVGPPDQATTGQTLLGPNTLQRLPALTFAIPDTPVWGHLLGGIDAGIVRIAPVTELTGDEGTDGVFSCPPGMGALACLNLAGQGDRHFEPGEREARMRLNVHPRLTYPISLGSLLHVTPMVAYREDVYVGEITGTWAHRGYALASLALDSELARTFGSGPSALRHSIQPTVQLMYIPAVWGTTVGTYDEVDRAVLPTGPGTGLSQALVEVRQRLTQGSREWLRLDIGQGFNLWGGGRLADTYARLATTAGPFRASALARFDPVRLIFSQLSAQARVSYKGGEVYAQYDNLAQEGSDRMRRPMDELVGPLATQVGTEAQQIVAGFRYLLRFGLGLSYEAVVVPQASPALMRLAQQRIGVTLSPACGCWSLEVGIRLIPTPPTQLEPSGRFQFNFGANLTIANFGSIGTGG